jgi:hypothetical protein
MKTRIVIAELARRRQASGDQVKALTFIADSQHSRGAGIVLMLLGWVIAASAALFGAPFWFDVLLRFA